MMNGSCSRLIFGHDVSLWPLLFIMAWLVDAGAGGITCRRYHRLVDGKCTPCPKCQPGYGLDKECGYGDGADAICLPCPLHHFNPHLGGSICQACLNCSHFNRMEAFKCRPVIDAECGRCKHGYFDANADDAIDSLIYPCEPCYNSLSHPDCHTAVSPQIVAPVTTKLQANAQPVNTETGTDSHSSRVGVIAVTLGVLCVTSLFAVTLLLIRQRKLMRRLQQWYRGGEIVQIEGHNEASRSPLIRQPHQHDHACMIQAQLAATPWCHVVALNPDNNLSFPHHAELPNLQVNRKRNLPEDLVSSAEESVGDEKYSDKRTLLNNGKVRKRPRVNTDTSNTSSGEDEKVEKEEPVSGITIRLRHKVTQDHKLNEELNQAHNPHPNIAYDGVVRVNHPESDEGEDEDDGPMEPQELPMDTSDVQSGTVSPGCMEHIVEYPTSETDDDDEDLDLQQLGACALRRHQQDSTWPYVDFTDMMQEMGSNLSIGDLQLGDSDQNSQGSSGNISQASTVLIRGRAESPSDITDGLGPGLPPLLEHISNINEGPDDEEIFSTVNTTPNMVEENLRLPIVTEPALNPNMDNNNPLNPPSMLTPAAGSLDASTTSSTAPIVTSAPAWSPPPSLAPAPRSLASLVQGFTSSNGDLAETAEEEANSYPKMQKTLDEERYVQALHLAQDHLISDLDFDICERLAAALLPRHLPGDRNFYHLGTALGIPLAVMEGIKAFDEVLMHLRRRRVLLVTLLQAVRALNRMDALYALCVWVLNNYSPSSPAAPPVIQQERHLVMIPESQYPLEDQSCFSGNQSDATPVQETGQS